MILSSVARVVELLRDIFVDKDPNRCTDALKCFEMCEYWEKTEKAVRALPVDELNAKDYCVCGKMVERS